MQSKFWTMLLGSPLSTHELAYKRLNKMRALAAFSPDALSSVAYASQEIFLGLVVAGSAGLAYAFPIALSIVLLLAVVALSYYQTIQGYPGGGGSYLVARENLGFWFGQVTGAALLIAYLLTAAVSLTAGVEAIASAFLPLWAYRVELALILLGVITLINMRGLQESGTVMSVPVYLFLFVFSGLLIYGLFSTTRHPPIDLTMHTLPATAPLTLFLILRTFAAGCTALTGIEAISNGVPSFKKPEVKNAGITLIVMAALMGFLFLGCMGLIQYFGVVTSQQETILSALARHLVGKGELYYLVQASTLLVLAVAANTSFVGFPRLVSIMAKDNLLPHQLANLGDRLVYTNGMLLLSTATAAMIIIFGGKSHALIPLFAIGAFLAYTLSQAGMVIHWLHIKGRGWQIKSLVNGIGALVTGAALVIVGVSKFLEGAWMVIVLVLVLIFGFQQVRRHYQDVAEQLTLRGLPPSLRPEPVLRLVVPISGVHRGIVDAVKLAQSLSKQVVAVYVEIEPGSTQAVQKKWKAWWPDIPLMVEPSPYRSLTLPLLAFLDRYDSQCNDGTLAGLVLPEFIPAKSWQRFLHNQQAVLLKRALLYRRRQLGYQRVIIDVPYHLKK